MWDRYLLVFFRILKTLKTFEKTNRNVKILILNDSSSVNYFTHSTLYHTSCSSKTYSSMKLEWITLKICWNSVNVSLRLWILNIPPHKCLVYAQLRAVHMITQLNFNFDPQEFTLCGYQALPHYQHPRVQCGIFTNLPWRKITPLLVRTQLRHCN